MRKIKISIYLIFFAGKIFAQNSDTIKKISVDKNTLVYNLSEDKSNYFQVTFLNQAWLRYTENNKGRK